MELRQIKGFLMVAEMLSFSRAAERLCISQSTLSEQIKQLEDELGCKLLIRSSHHVELTEAGERLQPIAAMTCRDIDACKDAVREMQEGIGGELRIGVTSTCRSVVRQPISEMVRIYPKLTIRVEYANGLTLSEMLLSRQVDLAVTMRPHHLPEGIEEERLFSDRLCLIVNRTHALAERRKVSLKEALAYPMAMPTEELHYGQELERLCRRAGQCPEPKVIVSDPDYLIELVAHSQLTTLHAGIVASGHDNLRAIPIEEDTEGLEGCIYRLKDGYRKQSAEELCRRIRNEVPVQSLMFKD